MQRADTCIFQYDDIPPLTAVDLGQTRPMPLFSPYHRFTYSTGFYVIPPPEGPYRPSSGRLMLQIEPPAVRNSTDTELDPDAVEFGVEPRVLLNPCFHVNMVSINLGCDSTGSPCQFTFLGLRYNATTRDNDVVANRTLQVAACPQQADCNLEPTAVTGLMDLTAIIIKLSVAGRPARWYADDLSLAWTDNSCQAAQCRSQVPDRLFGKDIKNGDMRRAISRRTWAG